MVRFMFAILFAVTGISSSHALNAQEDNIADDPRPFITVWKTDNAGTSEDNQILIPGTGTNYLIAGRRLATPTTMAAKRARMITR